jgi:histidinol-phosphatase (PHP family)
LFLADYHLHTYISHDGHETMEDMTQAAKRAGMSEICFTDHCDMADWHTFSRTDGDRDVPRQVIEDRDRLVREAEPGIEVRCGIELGEAHLYPELAAELSKTPGLDFIIGSLHMLREEGDFYVIDYTSQEQCDRLIDEYFDQCAELAKLDFFDVFGHIGYFRRYMSRAGFDARLDLSRWGDKITLLLKTLIANGRGIEVNTSGIREGLGTFPAEPIVSLYRRLGGEIVTVGSDAHYAENAGQDVIEGYRLLSRLGFQYVTVFRNRRPEFIKIQEDIIC